MTNFVFQASRKSTSYKYLCIDSRGICIRQAVSCKFYCIKDVTFYPVVCLICQTSTLHPTQNKQCLHSKLDSVFRELLKSELSQAWEVWAAPNALADVSSPHRTGQEEALLRPLRGQG